MVLKELCNTCSRELSLSGLYDTVMMREEMGSTYLGNRIATAHPHAPISPDTFIGVGILTQPINWDEDGNQVQLVFLVHIGKNNPRAFQIWNYLSRIVSDESFVGKLCMDPTYDHFIRLVEAAISEK